MQVDFIMPCSLFRSAGLKGQASYFSCLTYLVCPSICLSSPICKHSRHFLNYQKYVPCDIYTTSYIHKRTKDIFVWHCLSHTKIFHSFGDVIIAGEELQSFNFTRHIWPLSSEVFQPQILCHLAFPRILDTHT